MHSPQTIEKQGLWLEDVGLGLGIWEGIYENVQTRWIRWYDKDDNWLPSTKKQAQAAQKQAQAAEIKAQCLAEQLRALGVDPGTL